MFDVIGWFVAVGLIVATAVYWLQEGANKKKASKMKSGTSTSRVANPQSAESSSKEHEEKETKKEVRPKAKTTNPKKKPVTKSKKTPTHPRFVRRFGGHSGPITAMTVSPNGEFMATTGTDGLLRVCPVKKSTGDWHVQTKVETPSIGGIFQDHIESIAWCGDNRTLVGALHRSKDLVTYRVRKKKQQDTKNELPFELIELVKRRFSTESKEIHVEIDTCIVDWAHSSHDPVLLVVTGSRKGDHGNILAWNGLTGETVGTLTVPGSVRMSRDGQFLCGRGASTSSQIKIFAVQRKKIKGEIEPVFEKITRVMTIASGKKKIADADFFLPQARAIAIACEDGSLEIWNLDGVEYRRGGDPQRICSCTEDALQKPIQLLAAAEDGSNRLAVVTHPADVHVFSFQESTSELHLDFSIEATHADGVGDIQFCPSSGLIFTRGAFSKDVFAWSIEA